MVVGRPGAVVQRPTNVSWEVETVADIIYLGGLTVLEMLHAPEICCAARVTVDCSTLMHTTYPAVQVKLLVISIEQRQHRQHWDENVRE